MGLRYGFHLIGGLRESEAILIIGVAHQIGSFNAVLVRS